MDPLMSTHNLSDVSWVLLDTRPWIISKTLSELLWREDWPSLSFSLRAHSARAMNRVMSVAWLLSIYKTLFPSQRPGLCQSVWEHSWASWFSIHTPNFRHFHLLLFSYKGSSFTPRWRCFHLQRLLSTFNDFSLSDREKAPKKPQQS